MVKHHFRPIPRTVGVPDAVLDAINNNGLATTEQIDDLSQKLLDLSRIVETLQLSVEPARALAVESLSTNRALLAKVSELVDQVLAERQEVRRELAEGRGVPLPRDKAITLDDIKVAAKEGFEEATGRHTILTSDRARAMTRKEIVDSKREEEAAAWRSARDNLTKIAWRALGVLVLAAAGYLAGHLEGRATAPNTVAPAAK